MTPLAESVAIILGAASWPDCRSFEPHQSFSNSAEYFRDYLRENGVGEDNLLWLFGREFQPGLVVREIAEFLRKRAGKSIRNVLFYYVGHGGYRERDYFVALPCTSQSNLELTTLAVRHIAKTLSEETADKRQILILDACYAAGATRDFIYQGNLLEEVHSQVRDFLPAVDIETGTCLFCAAGPKIKAKAPWEHQYTMFSGALRHALTIGDPKSDAFLSLQTLAELVERRIRTTFRRDSVKPELHTPRQEKGDIRSLPLFPNPAVQKNHASPELRLLKAQIEQRDREMSSLGPELAWEREAANSGWYETLELRKELDQFGDATQSNRIVGIHGPATGEIRSLPYQFRATPELATCVLVRIADLQNGWSREGAELPPPGTELTGQLDLEPPIAAGSAHKGFAVEWRLINSFAMTTLDARLRNQPEVEDIGVRVSYPTRHLRLAVFFPEGHAPAETPRLVARCLGGPEPPAGKRPEHQGETARASRGFFFDRGRGCAILNLERVLPDFHYAVRWKLPAPPTPRTVEAALAKEQVRALLGLGGRERSRLDDGLETIRDAVCRDHLGLRKDRSRTVNLSLAVFDEACAATKVVCATANVPGRDLELPWGVGVGGWVMRRRRPAFVDTTDRGKAGIYRRASGQPDEHYLLCVPVPLPSSSDRRTELLSNPWIPCGVATLSCGDDGGNLDRMNSGDAASGSLIAAVSSALVDQILDILTREGL